MRLSKPRLLFVTALLVLLAVLAYGFAAQNTVNASYAGDGSGVVQGYTVNASFTLNSSDPSLVDRVTLTLNQSATEVHLALGLDTSTPPDGTADTTSNWVNCSNTSGNTWSCDVTGLSDRTVEDIVSVRVVATQ